MLNNEQINLKQTSLNLDILPARYRRKRISFKQIVVTLSAVVGILLLVLFYQIIYDTVDHTSELQARTEILNEGMQLRELAMVSQVNMTTAISGYEAIAAEREILYQDVMVIQDAADEVGITVKAIMHEGDNVTITCPSDGYASYSEYRNAFDGYYQALVQTGQFSSVERPATNWTPSSSLVRIEVSH